MKKTSRFVFLEQLDKIISVIGFIFRWEIVKE